jgi:replicative DNA helicase
MQQADRFLYSLVVCAGQRGRRYIVKQAYARELIAKWLCRMADVDEKKLRNGLISHKESQRLLEAARALNELPIYVKDDEQDKPPNLW